MSPTRLAQPRVSNGGRPERRAVQAGLPLALYDIRIEKDHAWRRLARERLWRFGRVLGLLSVDAVAILFGIVAARLVAPLILPARALSGEIYYLLPPAMAATWLAVQLLSLAGFGAHRRSPRSSTLRIALASLAGSFVFLAGTSYTADLQPATVPLILLASCTAATLTVGRRLGERTGRRLQRAGYGVRRVALITTPDAAPRDAERIARQREVPVRVCETIVVDHPSNGGRKRALRALERISRDTSLAGVVLSVDAPQKLVRTVIDGCWERGLPVYVGAPFLQEMSADMRSVRGGPLRVLEIVRPVARLPQMALKRGMDLLAAIVGLAVLAPVFTLIAIAIKIDTRGPVFFRQTRVGLGGVPFRMLKFRTMYNGADRQKKEIAHLNGSGDVRLFKVERDPRVTRVGRFLRKYSLDELPQLWNVLRGEMSLVGPRPFFMEDLDLYEPHHFQRYSVLPGITGQWQVNGRSHIRDFESVVAQDLDYIRNWSIRRDLEILLKTLPAVFRAQGAM